MQGCSRSGPVTVGGDAAEGRGQRCIALIIPREARNNQDGLSV